MNRPNAPTSATVGDFEMIGGPSKAALTARADVAGVARLQVEPEVDESTFWDSVHGEVQDRLYRLVRQVIGRRPEVRWVVGRSEGGVLILFSYVTFSRPVDDDPDPVIVGIAIARRDSAIRITGDVSGEESGRIFFDEDCEGSVPSEREAIVAEVLRIARVLSSQGEVVLRALEERPAE